MTDAFMPAVRPDLFGQLAATDPYQGRARRLFERGQVVAVNGNQADVRVGYDARNNSLELKQVPIISGYVPRIGDWVAMQYEAGHSSAPWITGPSMAADDASDSAGIGVFPVSETEPSDPQRSAIYFDNTQQTWRGWDGAAWVDLAGKLHNSLPDLQGGSAGQYYHLTAAEHQALQGAGSPPLHEDLTDLQGGAANDHSHLTAAQALALIDNMPFGATRVLYADADGHLASDAGLTYNASTDVLSAGGLNLGTGALSTLRNLAFDGAAAGNIYQNTADGSDNQWLWLAGGGAANAVRGGHIGLSGNEGQTNYKGMVYIVGGAVGTTGTYDGMILLSPNGIWPPAWLIDRSGNLLGPAGTAAAPGLARYGYADDGFYWPADGAIGVSLGGAEKWRFVAGALYPISDNQEDVGSSTLGVKALFLSDGNTTDPSANGEVRMQGTRRALGVYIGDTKRYLKGQRFVRTATYTNQSSAAENTVDTDTIDGDDWAAGKAWHFIISGTATSNGNGNRSSTIRVKLAGTTIATFEVASNAISSPVNDTEWMIEGAFTCRSVANPGAIACGAALHRQDTQGATISNTTDVAAGVISPNTLVAQSLVVTVQHNDASTSATRIQQVVVWED